MADHTLNCGKLPAQPALKRVHEVVHGTDGKRRIDVAVKIDDFTGGGFPHPHVMHFTERWELRRERGQELTNFRDACRLCIAAGQQVGGQRLDVRFDLNFRSEFTPDCVLQTARDLMCGGERLRAVDFKVD